jgi:hypothetical protein
LLVSCWKIEPSPLPPSASDFKACSFDGTAGGLAAGGPAFSAFCCSIEEELIQARKGRCQKLEAESAFPIGVGARSRQNIASAKGSHSPDVERYTFSTSLAAKIDVEVFGHFSSARA